MKNLLFSAAFAACVLTVGGTCLAQTDMPVRAKAKIKDDKVKMRDLSGEKNKLSVKKGDVKTKAQTPDSKVKSKAKQPTD